VPHVFVDGSSRPMEARHRLSALGGARVLGVRRGSLPILSSRFVDSGRRARGCSALEGGAGRVLLDCAHARRSLHVPAGPRVAPRPGRAVCGRVLRAESLPLVDRLLAKRLRRTTASVLLPLVVLCLLRIFSPEPEPGFRPALWLTLTLAAAWLTNAPSAVMIHYSGAGLALVLAMRERSWERPWRPLLRTALAIALGAGLASFYLIPTVYEMRWVNIGEVLSPGVRPQDNFLFTIIADPDHNRFNCLVSTVALAEIGLLA